jgi:type VI secretion system protein VasJ
MSEYLQRAVEVAEAYAKPFGGESPAGMDVSYDSEFESVKGEIDKLTAMAGAQPVWRDVVEISDRILQNKSKDLRLLVWSVVGRQQTAGIGGLVEGLAILKRVAEGYWETMNPPVRRAKGRVNLVDWMNEQIGVNLGPFEPSANDRDAVLAAQSLSNELDAFLAAKLADAYTGMGGLRSVLRDKVRMIPEPELAPSAVEAPPQASSASSASGSAADSGGMVAEIPTIGSADDVLPALRALGKSVMEAARHLRRADPANAWAYRIHRTGLWLAVKAPPPAEGNRTRIVAPTPDTRKKLEAKLVAEQWMDLLNLAEDLSGQSLFWLDLHRIVALAMDRLGALFMDARTTLGREVVSFLDRYPTLSTLCFSDGTPFADAGTQSFLDAERKKHGTGGGSGGGSRLDAEDEERVKRFEEARELVSGGKVGEGLGLAVQLAARAPDARVRFRGRLELAQLALQGGKPDVGRPILEQLLEEANARNLEEWEPSLCAAVHAALVAAHRALGTSLDTKELRPLFDRLCRLDPAAALRWSGS